MSPQQSLFDYEQDLSKLSEAERDAYEAVERGEFGVREYARETGRRPGTIGNLLRRARDKLEEREAS